MIIRPPAPDMTFGGGRIAWGVTKKRLLIGFLEWGFDLVLNLLRASTSPVLNLATGSVAAKVALNVT